MSVTLRIPTKPVPSLQDIAELVRADTRLTPKKRQERLSAITSVCKWLTRTPGELPADLAGLGLMLAGCSPAGCGVSVGRFANVRSALKRTLEDCGITGMERRDRVALAPQWKSLADLIANRYDRAALTRFIRFLSAREIAPEAVTDSAVTAYRDYLAGGFKANGYKVTQAAVRTWNRLVDGGWPVPRLTPLKTFERYTLTWEQVAPSLRAEIEKWLAICAGEDVTDDRTPPRPLRPDTILSRRYAMLQLISGLPHSGRTVSHLAELCDPELVKASLRFHVARYHKRHGVTTGEVRTPTVFAIADLPRQIAKHYLHADSQIVAALTDLARRFRPGPSTMGEMAQRRLEQIEDPQVLRKLLRYPILEMRKLAVVAQPTPRDVSRFATLLAIGFLRKGPLRIKTLAALDLDSNFKFGARRGDPIGVTVTRRLLKVQNSKTLKFQMTGELAEQFLLYLRRFRPLLLKEPCSAVFLSPRGRPKNRKVFGKQISGLLRREIGLVWHPQLFRHLSAYVLRKAGGNYVEAQLVLGHRSADTTRRSYEGFDAAPAFATLDRLIDETMGPLPPKPRPRKPRV